MLLHHYRFAPEFELFDFDDFARQLEGQRSPIAPFKGALKEIQSRLADGCAEPELDASPELDMRPPPWPLFVLLLLAHGWFRRPRPFPLGREGDTPSANPRAMIPRALGFVAAWAAAFALLPAGWVALALLAWGVLVGPSVIALHRAFQNVPTGEPEPI